MASTKPRQAESGESFLEGKLLIAMPGMPDPRFEKSVVFMCAHSAKGAMEFSKLSLTRGKRKRLKSPKGSGS